eukprot:TRINITY_DN22583_c0_g1_i2.p1 TRINITY_DN22583_c0_g1~~TRINITY_DN22583_c0_g1_i2.p1  ORF type:complete len:804 (+),score=113.45 TRINITY_DN22583_c0_g1_i2:93-2504(+)
MTWLQRRNSEDSGTTEQHTTTRPQGIFVDETSMKDKLREKLAVPQYDVRDFYKQDGFCQLVARHHHFEQVTLGVIALNALWLSIDADLNKAVMFLDAHPVFQIAEHFFCMYFTFEWVIRFASFQVKWHGLRDAWFVFDTFMVLLMVVESWLVPFILIATGTSNLSAVGDASSLRLLRLLRLTRMARMAKLLRSMPELLILIKGMAHAMRSVFFTLLLLAIIIYVFAIAFRQLTSDTHLEEVLFPSIGVTMHLLLLDGTLMDSTGTVVQHMLLEESYFCLFLFYLFILLAALTVMNMLIGVLCEVVSAVASTEREGIMLGTIRDGIMPIIADGQTDDDAMMISRAEFDKIIGDPQAVQLLDQVGVDVYSIAELADFIFKGEGDKGGPHQLPVADFVDLIVSLRGGNSATVKDIVDLRKFVFIGLNELEARLTSHMTKVRDPTSESTRSYMPGHIDTNLTSASSLVTEAKSHECLNTDTPSIARPVPEVKSHECLNTDTPSIARPVPEVNSHECLNTDNPSIARPVPEVQHHQECDKAEFVELEFAIRAEKALNGAIDVEAAKKTTDEKVRTDTDVEADLADAARSRSNTSPPVQPSSTSAADFPPTKKGLLATLCPQTALMRSVTGEISPWGGPPEPVWVVAIRLEGVLSAAWRDLERFVSIVSLETLQNTVFPRSGGADRQVKPRPIARVDEGSAPTGRVNPFKPTLCCNVTMDEPPQRLDVIEKVSEPSVAVARTEMEQALFSEDLHLRFRRLLDDIATCGRALEHAGIHELGHLRRTHAPVDASPTPTTIAQTAQVHSRPT